MPEPLHGFGAQTVAPACNHSRIRYKFADSLISTSQPTIKNFRENLAKLTILRSGLVGAEAKEIIRVFYRAQWNYKCR